MRKYVTEFIGTFVLVFTVGCTLMSGTPLAPLAIGAALMVMVYAGGHISGGHYNPAVTLGVLLRGKMAIGDVLPYWVAQLFGALIAAWLARFVINPPFVHAAALGGGHVTVGAFDVGGVSGGAFNPAVAFGAMLVGLINWSNFWIYLVADLVGGAVAAIAFRYLNPHDTEGGTLPKISPNRPTSQRGSA